MEATVDVKRKRQSKTKERGKNRDGRKQRMSEDERQRDSYKKNYLSAAGVIYWSEFTDTSQKQ